MEIPEEFDVNKLLENAVPNELVSNWMLVAEVVSEHGKTLSITTSEQMTSWLAMGMLQTASDMVLGDSYNNGEFGGVNEFLEDEE